MNKLTKAQSRVMRENIKQLDVTHLGKWGLENIIDKLEEATPNVFTDEDWHSLEEAFSMILEALQELESKLENATQVHCDKCGCTELLCGHNKRG